jgi:hypothetical protein
VPGVEVLEGQAKRNPSEIMPAKADKTAKGASSLPKKAPTRGNASVGSGNRLKELQKFLREGGYTTDEVLQVLPLKVTARSSSEGKTPSKPASENSEEERKGPSGTTRRTNLRKARKALRDALSGGSPTDAARQHLERLCYLQDSTSLKDLLKGTSEEFSQLLESSDWIKEQLQDCSIEDLRKRSPQ